MKGLRIYLVVLVSLSEPVYNRLRAVYLESGHLRKLHMDLKDSLNHRGAVLGRSLAVLRIAHIEESESLI
jgi:hypothetical protein